MNCLDECVSGRSPRQLRASAGLHLFKSHLLGDLSLPGAAQWSAVAERTQWLHGGGELDRRTWESWFAPTFALPQSRSVETLNGLAQSAGKNVETSTSAWNALAFTDLMIGGLARTMGERIRSREANHVLLCRAHDYRAPSALCRHFDALELAAWRADLSEIPASAVRWYAAQAILADLERRWARYHGEIYRELPSPLARQWQSASATEKKRIRAAHAQVKPDFFEALIAQGDSPDWTLIGVQNVTPAWETLFAITADSTFLRHEDVLLQWAMDLVAAGFATHALAMCDASIAYSGRVTREYLIAVTTYQVFFAPDWSSRNERLLHAAVALTSTRWSDVMLASLENARRAYQERLAAWSMQPAEIWAVATLAGDPLRHALLA